jgi:AcrR family transcriptional regulator
MSPRGQKYNEQMRGEALEKITSAALAVFAEYGYHGATMKQIARAADLSYGLVYHYFPSKEEVFRHVIDSSFDQSISGTEMVLNMPGTAWEKIENLSDFLVREALTGDSVAYFLVVLHAMTQAKGGIPGFLDHIKRRVGVYYELLGPIIAEAQETEEAVPGDPYVLAVAYFSFVQGLALLMVQGDEMEGKITTDILTNVLRNK